ncbi:hypothetical protein P5673_031432 [Acropora cervicornis]|uniref:Uncharacterized protein n=1 Tax=Acropora cervicornis TaxID=6130 RepID=A0AAD9PSS8_ACRCE|nr:hypothetical protein P5673_031432 [Acropora cervicornis]
MIQKLTIKCPNSFEEEGIGCDWTGPLETAESHSRNCGNEPAPNTVHQLAFVWDANSNDLANSQTVLSPVVSSNLVTTQCGLKKHEHFIHVFLGAKTTMEISSVLTSEATEYCNLLSHYPQPCLKHMLGDKYYQHYAFLVGGIFPLSRRTTSNLEKMRKAQKLDSLHHIYAKIINAFIFQSSEEKSAAGHAPGWSSSLFVFEDFNGNIGKFLPRKTEHCKSRTNRTCLRDELYAIGKLKERVPGEPFEDDLILSTRVESISYIKFFNYLQLGDAVFYSQAYRGLPEGTTTLMLMHKKKR